MQQLGSMDMKLIGHPRPEYKNLFNNLSKRPPRVKIFLREISWEIFYRVGNFSDQI